MIENPVAGLTEYELRHLVTHLVETGRFNELHRLLRLECRSINEAPPAAPTRWSVVEWLSRLWERQAVKQQPKLPYHPNGWYDAKERIGDIEGFLSDLQLAWRTAEQTASSDQRSKEREQAIGLQCRYALIGATINSLASRIPLSILPTLIERGLWTVAQAVAYIRRIPTEDQRSIALVGVASYIPESLLADALTLAQAIRDENLRVTTLINLAPFLSDSLLEQTLILAQRVDRPDEYARLLLGLARHLPKMLLQQAFSAAVAMESWRDRARALPGLAVQLAAKGDPEQVLTAIEEIWDEAQRAEVLAGMAPWLPEPLLRAALEEARRLSTFSRRAASNPRATALTGIVPYLEKPLQEEVVRETLRVAKTNNHLRDYVEIVVQLAPLLSEAVLQQELTVMQGMADVVARSQGLMLLAPHLPAPLQSQAAKAALASVQLIEGSSYRAQVLMELVPDTPESLRDELIQMALTVAQRMESAREKAQVLGRLAPYLSIHLQQQAFGIAKAIADSQARATVLVELAPHVSRSVLQQVLVAAQALKERPLRVMVLAALAPSLAAQGNLQEALRVARELPGAMPNVNFWNPRGEALAGIVPYLSGSSQVKVLRELLAIAPTTWSIPKRAQVLTELAVRLPQPLQREVLQQALGAAKQIAGKEDREQAIANIARHLSTESLQQILAGAQALEDMSDCAAALALFVPHLPKPDDKLQQVREFAQAHISDIHDRAQGLKTLAFLCVKQGDAREALALVKKIWTAQMQAQALVELAPLLAARGNNIQALMAARMIEDASDRAVTLAGLAPYLPEPLQKGVLQEAVATARAISGKSKRAQTLAALRPSLAEPMQSEVLREALREAQGVDQRGEQVWALVEVAPHLADSERSEVCQQIISAGQRIWPTDESTYGWALASLAPQLSEPLARQALEIAHHIANNYYRAKALAGLLARLVELGCAEEALQVAGAVEDGEGRAVVLERLAPYLPESLLLQAVEMAEGVPELDSYSSNSPQASVLMALIPRLPEPLRAPIQEQALIAAQNIPDHEGCAQTLLRLAPQLLDPLQGTALRLALLAALRINKDRHRFEREELLASAAVQLAALSYERLYPIWSEVLHDLASHSRQNFLADLRLFVPIIAALGNEMGVIEAMNAIEDVIRWWP